MKVFIDGQEHPDLSAAPSAPEALQAAQKLTARSGRVVTEIRLDGTVLEEEAFNKVRGGSQVRFTSRPIRDLVTETLGEAQSYIPRLTQGLEEIASHFEAGEEGLAQGKLADAFDGLDWLLLVYQKCCALLGLVPTESERKGLEETLLASINHLATFLEGKHPLQAALCIRRELLPDIEKFSHLIQKLSTQAGALVQ